MNELDLVEALQTNLGGAVLDVFEEEPLEANNPLWECNNVIITPHISFIGNNMQRLKALILSNNRIVRVKEEIPMKKVLLITNYFHFLQEKSSNRYRQLSEMLARESNIDLEVITSNILPKDKKET